MPIARQKNTKKNAIYGGIIACVFVAIAWMMYTTFFANSSDLPVIPPELVPSATISTSPSSSVETFDASELDFVSSRQFQIITDNPVVIKEVAERTTSPFISEETK